MLFTLTRNLLSSVPPAPPFAAPLNLLRFSVLYTDFHSPCLSLPFPPHLDLLPVHVLILTNELCSFCSSLGTPPWAFRFQLQSKSLAVVAAFEVLRQLWLKIRGCLCHRYGPSSTRLSRKVRDNSGGLSNMERGSRHSSAGKARALRRLEGQKRS